MALEDAPKKYTKQVHIHLHEANLTLQDIDSVYKIVTDHPGRCPLFLFIKRPSGEWVLIESHDKYYVCPSINLQKAIDQRFGKDTYRARVDNSLPERAQRRWEKKGEPNGGYNGN